MSLKGEDSSSPISDEDLIIGLEEAVGGHVTRVKRCLSDYSSSFLLENLDIWFENCTKLQAVFKNSGYSALTDTARRIRPSFLFNPIREIKIYQNILVKNFLDTPALYGAIIDPDGGRYWLFIEKVQGLELYEIEDFKVWEEVSRWLAAMHIKLADQAKVLQRKVPLLAYTPTFYRRWMQRALNFSSCGSQVPIILQQLADHYDRIISVLMTLPKTIVHGDFYASNILTHKQPERLRICPVDWEMAALAPGLIDLAALIAGEWSEEEKEALAMAYYERIKVDRQWYASKEEFQKALLYCRLHLAVQWLGWALAWKPPSDHQYNWLGEVEFLLQDNRLISL